MLSDYVRVDTFRCCSSRLVRSSGRAWLDERTHAELVARGVGDDSTRTKSFPGSRRGAYRAALRVTPEGWSRSWGNSRKPLPLYAGRKEPAPVRRGGQSSPWYNASSPKRQQFRRGGSHAVESWRARAGGVTDGRHCCRLLRREQQRSGRRWRGIRRDLGRGARRSVDGKLRPGWRDRHRCGRCRTRGRSGRWDGW